MKISSVFWKNKSTEKNVFSSAFWQNGRKTPKTIISMSLKLRFHPNIHVWMPANDRNRQRVNLNHLEHETEKVYICIMCDCRGNLDEKLHRNPFLVETCRWCLTLHRIIMNVGWKEGGWQDLASKGQGSISMLSCPFQAERFWWITYRPCQTRGGKTNWSWNRRWCLQMTNKIVHFWLFDGQKLYFHDIRLNKVRKLMKIFGFTKKTCENKWKQLLIKNLQIFSNYVNNASDFNLSIKF